MKSKPLVKAIFLSCMFVPILSCRDTKTAKNGLNNDLEIEKPDTTIVKCINYPQLQFYIKKTSFGLDKTARLFCTVHVNKTDERILLFETSEHYENETPVNIYDDYFLWPAMTGGNNYYNTYKIVFKMSADTAFVLGNVCNYDDITGDGKPEMYNWYLIKYGQARAFSTFENEVVTINADTLSHSFPGNY